MKKMKSTPCTMKVKKAMMGKKMKK